MEPACRQGRARRDGAGGKVEPGETALAAVLREVREETALVCDDGAVVRLCERQIAFGGETWLGHFFVCHDTAEPKLVEPEKIAALRWVDLDEAGGLPAHREAFADIAVLGLAGALDRSGVA